MGTTVHPWLHWGRQVGSVPLGKKKAGRHWFCSISLEGSPSHLLSGSTRVVRITELICRRECHFPITRIRPALGPIAQGDEDIHSYEKSIAFCISYFSVVVTEYSDENHHRGERIYVGLWFQRDAVHCGWEDVVARAGSWLRTFHPHARSREKEQELGKGCKPWWHISSRKALLPKGVITFSSTRDQVS